MPYKFLIAGTNSGVGKTSVTISIIAALKSKNYNILPFKVGPDFIDTGYHSFVSGNPAINLDGWMLSKDYNKKNFYSSFKNENDIGIVEGVMGLYDGFSGNSEQGSSAQIAKWLNLPVILVVDCKSMARSVAAIINGYKNFDKNVNLKGVILNKVGSETHLNYLKEAIQTYCNVEIIGYFYRDDFPELSSRHLGLVTIEDNTNFKILIDKFKEKALERIDFEKLLQISYFDKKFSPKLEKKAKRVKIGVAKDNAFCFYYYDNLKIFEKYGAEISYFSPLEDTCLPDNINFIYLGGGYPELHAEKLSKNKTLILELKKFIEDGKIVYAECGGFVYLTQGVYINNNFFEFAGIFEERAILGKRLKALGYREITFIEDNFFGKREEKVRGHEFHYSYLENNGENLKKIYKITTRKGDLNKFEGYRYKNCLGSYVHLHFGSNEKIIENLVKKLEYFNGEEKIYH